MTTLVAIFDNAWTMEQAIERLVARGYDEAVYDEAIISENTGKISVPQANRTAGPGKPNRSVRSRQWKYCASAQPLA
jgi:hypothetical protein